MLEFADYKALWEQILTEIRTEVGEQVFSRWFNVHFIDFSDGKLMLSAPSMLYLDQINLRYPKIFEKKLKKLSGKEIPICIKADTSTDLSFSDIKSSTSCDSEKITRKSDNVNPKSLPSSETQYGAADRKLSPLQFNPEFTFENYVKGDNNDFAVGAAVAVSQNLGTPQQSKSYNPLLIYGGPGLGKTHLIQAIGNYVHHHSEHKIMYVTAEAFTNEFIETMQKDSRYAFKKKYRQTDLLIIDDIHFFEGKDACQEELFNTFNTLYNAGKQMVFTCDRPATELKKMADRLTSRLGSGLHVDIKIPNYETRCAILMKKLESFSVTIPIKVIELISKNISSNVRDMIAALNKLAGYAELTKKVITLDVAMNQLKDIFTSSRQSNIVVSDIIRVISSYYDISISDIKGRTRKEKITKPRQVAMYISRELTELSLTDIGEAFGGKDHTTVLHAHEKIKHKKQESPVFENEIQELINLIKESNVK